ncbi:MAG: response regulator [Candidatus Anammoxibacter sp.]
MSEKIKVLVVDDSSVFRTAISAILKTDKDIEVVGTASNGSIAIKKIPQLAPDVITMDIEMPVMDGITALREIKKQYPSIDVIMFSIHTERGAEMTIEALTSGATDFVAKPSGDGKFQEKVEEVRTKLLEKIKGCKGLKLAPKTETTKTKRPSVKTGLKPMVMARDIIAIGSSTGGPNALSEVIPLITQKYQGRYFDCTAYAPCFYRETCQPSK